MSQQSILDEIIQERKIQDAEWGGQRHDDTHDWYDWREIIYRQMMLMSMESDDARRRKRLIKVAAVAMAAVESIDRKYGL